MQIRELQRVWPTRYIRSLAYCVKEARVQRRVDVFEWTLPRRLANRPQNPGGAGLVLEETLWRKRDYTVFHRCLWQVKDSRYR
jgi:hypothetical protein